MLGAEDPEDEEAADAEADASQVHATDLGQDEPSEAQKAMMEEESANNAPLDYILQAGTSRRIWGELYKVIDSSDIILHVLDARDPIGTRCHSVENYLAKEKRGKKVIYILNKVDLIPGWAAVSLPFLSWLLSLSLPEYFVSPPFRLSSTSAPCTVRLPDIVASDEQEGLFSP